MSPLSLDTELRTPSPPTLELGHSLVEEHQLSLAGAGACTASSARIGAEGVGVSLSLSSS